MYIILGSKEMNLLDTQILYSIGKKERITFWP